MRKFYLKTLFLACTMLMSVSSVWGQASYNHSYTVGSTATAGSDYFLYNIGAGQFLTNGKAWGTHASVDNSGRVLTLTASESGFKIYTNYVSLNNRTESKEGYLFANNDGVFVDNTTIDDVWVFESVNVDGYTNAYKIKKDNSTYLNFNTSDCNVNAGEFADNNNYYWLLISKDTRETAGDYSHYIINSQMNACWEWKTWCGSTENNWDNIAIGPTDTHPENVVGDKYYVEYDIYQDIKESVPNGKYKLYAQTCYVTNAEGDAPVLYANDDTQSIALWNATDDGEAGMVNASIAFTAGKYANNVTTVVTNNTLRIGVNMKASHWTTFDNFVLDYLGTCLVNDAVEFTNGSSMTADTWYYYDVPYSISYNVTAGTDLSDISYSTDGTQLTANATTSTFTDPQTLSAGRYYFKSSSAQTLTFTPADYATDKTEEVYDFAASNTTSSSQVCSYGKSVSINGTGCSIISNSKLEMNDRFAGQVGNGSNWNIYRTSNGLGTTVARVFGILNLKEGDYVIIKYSGSAPTFIGNNNISGQANGTSVVSETVYKMNADGNLALSVPKAANTDWTFIKAIKISTSAPVLSKPTITYNGLGESEGLYYTQVTITSPDEGVTFYNESDEEVTSPYTFTSAGTLTVYAAKDGRTNSAKASYTSDGSSYILANSVNTNSLGSSNFSGNGGGSAGNGYGYYWLSSPANSDNTTAIPGLSFYNNNSECWGIIYKGSTLYEIQNRRNATRSISCTVLNEDRIASLTRQGGGTDWLNNITNWASFAKNAGINNYKLFTKSNATVSVTIGSTGYSTFSCPVPLDFSGVSGLTAYVATNHNSEYVTLKSIETAPANTGLVLKGTPSTEYSIPVTASPSTPETNYMVGCIVETSVATNLNYYVLVNNEGTAEFQRLDVNGATIPAGKAYLNVPSAGANLRISFDADETTGIKVVEGSESRTEIYNLSGQRVINPTKGLYIMNGKKVFIK